MCSLIYFALPICYLLPRSPTFCHVHPVGVGVRFIVPVSTKFHKMVLRISTVDIAIHRTVPTNTHKMALQYIVPHPRNTHKMALRFSTVGIAMPLFLFIIPHVLPRPFRRRRGPIYHTVSTNTHQMALQFVIFCTSRQIEKREKQTHDVCFSLVFYVLN